MLMGDVNEGCFSRTLRGGISLDVPNNRPAVLPRNRILSDKDISDFWLKHHRANGPIVEDDSEGKLGLCTDTMLGRTCQLRLGTLLSFSTALTNTMSYVSKLTRSQ